MAEQREHRPRPRCEAFGGTWVYAGEYVTVRCTRYAGHTREHRAQLEWRPAPPIVEAEHIVGMSDPTASPS